MISVVCVYNNRQILDDWLLSGLKTQTAEHELILLDNTGGKYQSAAGALNYGATLAHGEYLMFVHQDVKLWSGDWLKDAEKLLAKTPQLGVAGSAGMKKLQSVFKMVAGEVPLENGEWVVYHGPEMDNSHFRKDLQAPAVVQTLDELLLIVPRTVFNRLKFDNEVCSGWHLYGVDYSLSVAKLGLKAYVLPVPVCHRSRGVSDSEQFYSAVKSVLKKHSGEKTIFTTCGLWSTNAFLNSWYYLVLAVRSELGRCLGRNDYGGSLSLKRFLKLAGLK